MSQPFDLFDLATDPVLEATGVYTTLDGFGDIEWQIASIDNDAYRGFMATAYKANKHLIEAEQAKSTDGEETAALTELMRKLYTEGQARYVLVGWKGAIPVRGVATPYSYEAALNLLTNIRKLREAVLLKSNDTATYRLKWELAEEKN